MMLLRRVRNQLLYGEASPSSSIPASTWSTPKKMFTTWILALMGLALTFTSTAYSVSNNALTEAFHISHDIARLGISLFVLGFAIAPLLFGPLCQKIGHRPVYVFSFIGFTAFSFGVSEATNIQTLLISRFFAGACGSSSLNNIPSSYRSMSTPQNYGRYFALYAAATFGGTGLGGFIGAYIQAKGGWRWNLRMQALLVATSTVLCILFVPEMAPPSPATTSTTSKTGRTKTFRRGPDRTGEETICEEEEDGISLSKASKGMIRKAGNAVFNLLVKPFVHVKDPVVLAITLYLSLLYAVLYGFFVEIPLAFQNIRGYSERQMGIVYLSLLIGFMIGAMILSFVQHHFTQKEHTRVQESKGGSTFQLETLLVQAIYGTWLAPIGLFLFAWTAPFPSIYPIAPCIGIALFCIGTCTTFTSLLPYLVVYSGSEAPSSMALCTFVRSSLAAACPLFIAYMMDAMAIQGGTSLLGGIAILLAPLPFVLHRIGARLRQRGSRNDRAEKEDALDDDTQHQEPIQRLHHQEEEEEVASPASTAVAPQQERFVAGSAA